MTVTEEAQVGVIVLTPFVKIKDKAILRVTSIGVHFLKKTN
jgi:hypothetical protein